MRARLTPAFGACLRKSPLMTLSLPGNSRHGVFQNLWIVRCFEFVVVNFVPRQLFIQ